MPRFVYCQPGETIQAAKNRLEICRESGLPEFIEKALKRWAGDHPLTIRMQAEALDLPESTLANSINPEISNCNYQLRRLINHMWLLGDLTFLDDLEFAVGRVAFPIPQPDAPPADLNREFACYIREFSDVVDAHGKAIAGRIIRPGEVDDLRREVKELVRQALTYLAAVEKTVEVI